jgi:two-component system chemotaxis response regulator CheY
VIQGGACRSDTNISEIGTLPARFEGEQDPPIHKEPIIMDGSLTMKILLVDDSRTIRNIQKNTLSTLGYNDICDAADGVEALTVMAAAKPDLMIVDWNMPNMDGMTLVRKVREKDKALPIILCTTEAEESRVIEAIKAGVNSYVVKPFTAETLGEKINQTLANAIPA